MRRPRSSQILSNSSHPLHFESGMPANLWGIDRREVWRTCFCFHVRTATIFIGVLHLMSYILTLSFVAATFMYDPNQDGLMVTIKPDHLPTPQSKISAENLFQQQEPKMQPYKSDGELATTRMDYRNPPFTTLGMDPKRPNSQHILLEVCNMLITLLMVYGAVRGKPSYLMPFFVLKVFEFCIFCLRMVGYFSYLPNVTDMIAQQPGLPFREELLRMDPQLLSLVTLIIIVSSIAIKAYIIGVIWNCYKYLMLRNTVIRGVIAYRQDDPSQMLGIQQNLLPDLPDYETAVNDPRYAKKPPLDPSATSVGSTGTTEVHLGNSNMIFSTQPSTLGLPPPPPYSAAVAAADSAVVVTSIPVPEFTPPVTSSQNQQQQSSPAPPQPQITPSTQTLGSESADVEITEAVVVESSPSTAATVSSSEK